MYFINYIVSSHQITSPGYVVYLFMYSMGEGPVHLHSSKSGPIIYYIHVSDGNCLLYSCMKEFPQDTLKKKVRKARMFIQIVCRTA